MGAGVGKAAARAGDAATPGAAAVRREDAKMRKYGPICDRIGAGFKAAIIVRLGHCGDGLTACAPSSSSSQTTASGM